MSAAVGQPIMGILGFDVLQHYCIQLDFSARKLRFMDGDHANKHHWGKAFRVVAFSAEDAASGGV
jgi:hypothetical protein